jgi:multisite-specific tRNA:(cytosine-C5)-methyltransferase
VHKRDFGKGKRAAVWAQDGDARDGQAPAAAPAEAPAFAAYCVDQGVVPRAELDAFLAAMRTPLPLTFRVNGTGPFAAGLVAELEAGAAGAFAGKATATAGAGADDPAPAPFSLPWYPNRLAWQLATTRNVLRRNPGLAALHKLVVAEHNGGRITRQEAVSMVPPLLLDVQPHHIVLDACASPGSKTAQILEAFARGGPDAAGCVVANDRDARRANMLAHTTARLASPGLVVSCHDAAFFPTPGGGAKGASPVLFDRVLADVPCSGDGTLRKSPDVWRKWSAAQGMGLHALQFRIAARCAALLAPGGRMVYSTCSLNPLEDEAVVAALLSLPSLGADLSLVDVSSELPGLKRRPGLSTWRVPSKKGDALYASLDDAVAAGNARGLLRTHFAPPPDAAAAMRLDRALRVLPHDTDTGGFFIAVLEKRVDAVKPPPRDEVGAEDEAAPVAGADAGAEPGAEEPAAATGDAPAADAAAPPTPPGPRRGDGVAWGGADPLVPVDPAAVDLASLAAHYGLPADAGPLARLLCRSVEDVGAPRKLYCVSAGAARLLAADAAGGRRLKVATAGVKMFERQEGAAGKAAARAAAEAAAAGDASAEAVPPPYRVTHDGLHLLSGTLTRQVVRPTLGEVLAFLDDRSVTLPASVHVGMTKAKEEAENKAAGGGEGGEGAAAAAAAVDALVAAASAPAPAAAPQHKKTFQTWADPATLADVAQCAVGGCVVALRAADAAALGFPPASGLAVAGWRGRASITVHVNKGESGAYAARLRAAMAAAGLGGEGREVEAGGEAVAA